MTDDRGAAALAERLRAFDAPSSYDEWLARHDATYEGDAAFILGEHGVFLPDGREVENAAIDVQTERDMAEGYYRTLEAHLRDGHQCEHSFVDVADEAALSPEPKP